MRKEAKASDGYPGGLPIRFDGQLADTIGVESGTEHPHPPVSSDSE